MHNNISVGDIVLGNWKLVRLIGEGSYGSVYEAQREDFGQIYKSAVKVITIPQSQSEIISARTEGMDERSITSYFHSIVEEVVQEFSLMSKLKGTSNIVSYEDHEVVPFEGGIGWTIIIRMELLTPMLDYISTRPMTRADVIKVGIDLCRALELCQRYNIIHRDIKPENIFVSEIGDFKLGDFGIARTIEKTTGGLSKKGTYTYMAPEVYSEGSYGPSVDTYSLGIVLYRLLNNNRTPFLPPPPAAIKYSDREQALLKRVSGAKIPKPSNADADLSRIVLKACAYDPKDRYRSPKQMRTELEGLLNKASESKTISRSENSAGSRKTDFDAVLSLFEEKSLGPGAPSAGEETVSIWDRTSGRYEKTSGKHEKSRQGIQKNSAAATYKSEENSLDETISIWDRTSGHHEKTNTNSTSKTTNHRKRTIIIATSIAFIVLIIILAIILSSTTISKVAQPPYQESGEIEIDDSICGKCGDNLSWELSSGVLSISGTGPMYDYACNTFNTYDTYSSYDSTSSTAPWNNSKNLIHSVSIGNGVTAIGDCAFYGCNNLKSITIQSSVTAIRGKAFEHCSSLTDITIPSSVTNIGDYAFRGCSSLTSITIPSGVTSIMEHTFENCSSFTSIIIPSSVTSIRDYAFYGCNNLKSITIPLGVTTIGQYTFCNCSSLTYIEIPSSVTFIGDGTFKNCTCLTSTTIPSSIITIGWQAFAGCNNLKDVYYYGTKEQKNKIAIYPDNAELTSAIWYFIGAYKYKIETTGAIAQKEEYKKVPVASQKEKASISIMDYYSNNPDISFPLENDYLKQYITRTVQTERDGCYMLSSLKKNHQNTMVYNKTNTTIHPAYFLPETSKTQNEYVISLF